MSVNCQNIVTILSRDLRPRMLLCVEASRSDNFNCIGELELGAGRIVAIVEALCRSGAQVGDAGILVGSNGRSSPTIDAVANRTAGKKCLLSLRKNSRRRRERAWSFDCPVGRCGQWRKDRCRKRARERIDFLYLPAESGSGCACTRPMSCCCLNVEIFMRIWLHSVLMPRYAVAAQPPRRLQLNFAVQF
jgi:hypothetical protein